MIDLDKCWAVEVPSLEGDTHAIRRYPIFGRCDIIRPPLHDGEQRHGERIASGIVIKYANEEFGLYYDTTLKVFRTAPLRS